MIESQGDVDPVRTTMLKTYAAGFKDTTFKVCMVNAAGLRVRIL